MQTGTLERPPRIAYLGPPASFSHQAAIEVFRGYPPETLHPLPSFKAIFTAIQNSPNEADEPFTFAVLPVENSTSGWVQLVLELLVQCGLDPATSLFPDVEVVAEHYFKINHCLYVHPSVLKRQETTDSLNKLPLPISDLNITALHTHPQVWGQCKHFLSEHFQPGLTERIDASSTSAAAAFVAKYPLTTNSGVPAAICSQLAGERNGLGLVASVIEDEPGKTITRFLVVRNRKSRLQPPIHLCQPADPSSQGALYYKSLLTFTIPHMVPGSLASALQVFAKHDLNLTKIAERPSGEEIWHYAFFVECEEQILEHDEHSHSRIQNLLLDLGKVAEKACWLGTWLDRSRYG